jgi:acetyltransferase-like isoleucine patch superfamily enzyme
MSLIAKLLGKSRICSMQLPPALYRWWFLLLERSNHRAIELGEGVGFHVPVRSGGRGTLRVGKGTQFGYALAHRLGTGEIMLQPRAAEAEIVIGEDNWFNNNTMLCAMQSIRVGNECRIGDNVAIMDADFHEINPATRNRSVGEVKPVKIGNRVWIGSRAMILKGVTIGDNSVVGAMSLVTKDIPANCVAAGVPAKVVRQIE